MKSFASFLLALFSMAVAVDAQAPVQVTKQNIKVAKVIPALVATPEFSVDIPNKRAEKMKWLEIEVEFDVEKIDATQVIDELTFKYTLLLNGKLYTGEVTHVNIPKGNNHYSVMYMSPRSLDRATLGKQLNQGMIQNIWVSVERQGAPLGEKSVAAGAIPPQEKITGMLVPKSETPFQVLWWDRYEAVKAPTR